VDRAASDPAAARLMTHSTDRPIPFFIFTPKSDSVLYMQDKAGDENYLFYRSDIASGAERALTPFENTRGAVVGGSHTIKDKVLIGLNNRDPRYHDVHLLDLDPARSTLSRTRRLHRLPRRRQLTCGWASARTPPAGTTCSRSDGKIAGNAGEAPARRLADHARPRGYTADGGPLLVDSRGRDTAALSPGHRDRQTALIAEDRADIAAPCGTR
jgi:hypothetical protein